MPTEHEDFYKRLRKKVQKWARSREGRGSEYTEYILLAPDLFHLMLRLSLDKDVAVKEKAKLGVAIAYFVSPVDLLPEWLVGPIGYLDDVGLAVYVLHSVLEHTDEEVVTRHWAGDADLLQTVRTFMEKGDQMLGSGLWGRLRSLIEPGRGKAKASTTPAAQPTRSTAARATERKVLEPTEKEPAKKAPAKKAPAKKAAKKTTGKTASRSTSKRSSKDKTANKGAAKGADEGGS